MNCPKCDVDIGDSYKPDDRSVGIRGGWYCEACELAIAEHEVPREPVAGDVETMSAREFRGDRPLGTKLTELSTQPGPKDDVGHPDHAMPPDSVSADGEIAEPSEVAPPPVTPSERSEKDFMWNIGTKRADLSTVAPSQHYLAPVLLTAAALALSAVGIAINGWFARSLGSSDVAGWLFMAVGVAADLAALVLPSTAAGLWHTGQRAIALVGWVVWFVTFVFAVTAGIGFASTNIADVTLSRTSRVTPAVTSARAMLLDAMAARDRECKGGVGRICREREATVAERRQLLDSATTNVGQAADPQTDAAIKLVAWISGGMMRPAPEDFAMLRLILLALLPQIGGMLLLIRHRSQTTGGWSSDQNGAFRLHPATSPADHLNHRFEPERGGPGSAGRDSNSRGGMSTTACR
jgi:hypothetical protein